MTRVLVVAAMATLGLALPRPGAAASPVSPVEVIATVRALAAAEIGVKANDIDIHKSLAAQGFDEHSLRSLIIAVQQEYSVMISEREMHEARWNEPAVPLSVRLIADLVVAHKRAPGW